MITRLGIVILLMSILVGCSENPEKPDHLIPQKKYVDMLVELQLVRSYADNAETDSATVDSLTQEVYKRYNVTAQQFKETHQYYQQFPQEQKERVEKAIEELKMDQVEDTSEVDRKVPKHH